MAALAIVEPFSVVEDGLSCGGMAWKNRLRQFGFQGREKALHRRIIPTIAGPTHTGGDAVGMQGRPIVGAGILMALITVVQQASWGLAPPTGIL